MVLVVDTSKVPHDLTEQEIALRFNIGVAAMVVGLPAITPKNLDEWRLRLRIYESLVGFSFVSKGGEYVSLIPLLPRFLGATFNIAEQRRPTFMKRMVELVESDLTREFAA